MRPNGRSALRPRPGIRAVPIRRCVARRQTVIVSVLESLRQYLSTFSLSSVIREVTQWLATGHSCFARLAKKLGLIDGRPHARRTSLLDRLLPLPDG